MRKMILMMAACFMLTGCDVVDTSVLKASKHYRIYVAKRCDKIIQKHKDDDKVDDLQCKRLVKVEQPICEKHKIREQEDCSSPFNNILRITLLHEEFPNSV